MLEYSKNIHLMLMLKPGHYNVIINVGTPEPSHQTGREGLKRQTTCNPRIKRKFHRAESEAKLYHHAHWPIHHPNTS